KTARYTVQAAFCIGALWAVTAGADVFKFTDEKGNVQYTDRPLKLPAERLSIQSQRTDVVALDARVAEDFKATEARETERKKLDTAATEKKKAADANAAGKVEACNKAREDYRIRSTNFRLYEEQAGGERRYLNSAEIDATRDAAKKAMEDLCAGL
ncbi:MAG TPA: DUF4124 domain-containing protein, partial [Steroidobacteraceae bacterium]|nr:DUF4124 domain-containing protein [Steroidobacteraceae bacterium]